jgi:amino acid transporter
VQNICSIGKLLGLAVIICFGAYALFIGRYENFVHPFENSTYDLTRIAVAIYSGIFSYEGWRSIVNVIEEIKNPQIILKQSIIISISIIIVFYMFSNIAYFTLLSPKEMIESSAVAVTFASKLIGPYASFMSIFVALSTFGYLNGSLFHFSRSYYAAARAGHLPSVLALISINNLTPILAIIYMVSWNLIFFVN